MIISAPDLQVIKKLDLKKPYVWIATWFGFGFISSAPGTWGSFASIPFALIIFSAFGLHGFLAGTLFITSIGFWASDKFDQATGAHDNKMIVIDEAAGQWLTLAPALYFYGATPLPVIAAFFLFRFLDILKPWPISMIDKKLKGAAGVMLDDIAAGIIGSVVIIGVHHYV